MSSQLVLLPNLARQFCPYTTYHMYKSHIEESCEPITQGIINISSCNPTSPHEICCGV